MAAQSVNPLLQVKSWGYQLRLADPAEIAASGYDLMVIDFARSGIETGQFSADEIATMRRMPDGRRRVVLAYLSIGEAERYRYYWQQAWYATPPAWLGAENPEWRGNYPVRYWNWDWQAIMFGHAQSYLDRIMAAGFDGVYLDRVDVYAHWEKENPHAKRQMLDFVAGLSAYAKARKPEFLVVPQNAEELLDDKPYLRAIDGIAKEDLLYGMAKSGQPNPKDEVDYSIEKLRLAKQGGKGVFAVEYICKAEELPKAERRLRQEAGAVPYFAPRTLYRLELGEGDYCKPAGALGQRVALVIGNAAYAHARHLPQPEAEAKAVAASLRRLGFTDVRERTNLGRDALGHELQRFAEAARQADWAVIYYTGHGLTLDGSSYIIPTDAQLASPGHAGNQLVPIETLADATKDARQLRLMILDACRPNPFLAHLQQRGMTIKSAPGVESKEPALGILALFASRCQDLARNAAGSAAPRVDTAQASSPAMGSFAATFVQHLETPGLDIPLLFGRVRDAVRDRSKRAQEPVSHGPLPVLPMYFNPPTTAAAGR